MSDEKKFEYNPDDDKILDSKEILSESGRGGYIVKLVSYKGSEPKIQINPFFINTNTFDKQYTKLSRISLELAGKVAEAILLLVNDFKINSEIKEENKM